MKNNLSQISYLEKQNRIRRFYKSRILINYRVDQFWDLYYRILDTLTVEERLSLTLWFKELVLSHQKKDSRV